MKITNVLFVLGLLMGFHVFGQEVRSKVYIKDSISGEPLTGAKIELVVLSNGNKVAKTYLSGMDGSFDLKEISNANDIVVFVDYIGYERKGYPFAKLKKDEHNYKVILLQMSHESNHVDVTVLGHKNGEDKKTFLLDRNAQGLQNSLSARAIEISPDLSVANAVQRISGVTIERSNNGEGQYAIVRGMDKRYNYTLVNGIKIPSPDNKNRYVPLDIFPADMLQRLEVIKSLTPDREGDAIGGVVNMVMKDAPSKFEINGNAAIGVSNAFFDKNSYKTFDNSQSLNHSPRYSNGNSYTAPISDFPMNNFTYATKNRPVSSLFGLSAGGRLLHDKLGVMVAGSYQSNYRNVHGVFFDSETDASTNNTTLDDIKARYYSIQQQRSGVHARLDYKINNKNMINLYAGWMSLVRDEYRSQVDTNLVLGRTVAGSGRIGIDYRGLHDNQQIWNATLSGKHEITDALSLDWSAVFTKASDNRPDEATLSLSTGVLPNTSGVLVSSPLTVLPSDREWYYSSDKDKSGYLNLHYKQDIGSIKAIWSIGGMYRNKERTSRYDDYQLNPLHSNDEYIGNIATDTFTVYNASGSSTDALNYDATENVGAVYAMTKLNFGRWTLIGGARLEHTKLSWVSAISDQATGKTGNIKYYDILPSANIKYNITLSQDIKASYYSAISRPNFYEVVPHTGGDPDADYKEIGNPYLKRATADNYDIRYGWYPKGLDQVLLGVFYKRIKNPIEYALETVGSTEVYYRPDNFGTANNKGIEFDAVKYWYWFGVKANYTYTDSKITTTKVYRHLDDNDRPTESSVSQSRPLQGQSKHVGNFSFLFKDDQKLGLNAQLAFSYTGKRINTVSEYLDNDIWQRAFIQTDFSAEKRVARHWFAYIKVNNILNSPYQLEIPQKLTANTSYAPYQSVGKNVFIRKDRYGANALIGIKFKL